MVAQLEVRLKEEWFDMKKKKAIARPMNSTAGARPMDSGVVDMFKKGQAQNGLQEGQARITPKKMSKGGAMHKMPDGSMMKGAVHKAASGKYIKPKNKKKNTKVSKSQCSRRADGCAVKGKTRGRMV